MKNLKTRELILIALFVALTSIGAYITIPFGPVPITLQSLFCLLSALLLGAKLGALSQILYLLIGLAGLPIFSGGKGGIGFILYPTFGFVLGFIAAALITGYISEKLGSSPKSYLLASLCGTLTIYLLGSLGFYLNMNFIVSKSVDLSYVLKVTILPFIPGDLLKAFSASLVAVPIIKTTKKLQN